MTDMTKPERLELNRQDQLKGAREPRARVGGSVISDGDVAFDPRVPLRGEPFGDLCGVCPRCGRTDGYINIGDVHWFYCLMHKTCWIAGSRKFDQWPVESLGEQERIYDQMSFEDFDHLEEGNTMWLPVVGGRVVIRVPGPNVLHDGAR